MLEHFHRFALIGFAISNSGSTLCFQIAVVRQGGRPVPPHPGPVWRPRGKTDVSSSGI